MIKKHKYNAKKIIVDGIKYDSTRESYFAQLLKTNGINYEHQYRFLLQAKFRYMGKAVREIAVIPDFVIFDSCKNPVAIIDVKGLVLPQFLLKVKLLMRLLQGLGFEVPIYTPRNNKECLEVINKLKK